MIDALLLGRYARGRLEPLKHVAMKPISSNALKSVARRNLSKYELHLDCPQKVVETLVVGEFKGGE